MKKKKDATDQNAPTSLSDITLTKEHVKMIQGVILSMRQIKMDQEALSEDIKGVAAKLNVKPGEIKEMANWIMQEEEKGGVIDAKEKKLDLIRQVFDLLDASQGQTSNASKGPSASDAPADES